MEIEQICNLLRGHSAEYRAKLHVGHTLINILTITIAHKDFSNILNYPFTNGNFKNKSTIN